MASDDGSKDKKSKREKQSKEISGSNMEVKQKEKKEKKKNIADAVTDEENIAVETPKDKGEEKKKKRKRKDEDRDSETKKSRKDDSAVATPDTTAVESHSNDPQGTSKQEKKKKKKDKAPTVDLDVDMTAAASTEPEQDNGARKRVKRDKSTRSDSHKDKASKKSRKGQRVPQEGYANDLPNPSGDASLSDKARTALSYVRTRLANPSEWKFNKGLQNWIVRHLWSRDAIPAEYFGLVTSYLADSKGGVRDNLLQTCRKYISAASEASPETVTDATNAPPTEEAASSIARERAQLLLDALTSSKTDDSENV